MKQAAVRSILVAVVLLALVVTSEAQHPTTFLRLGYLVAPSLSANTARHESFRQGLCELGYVEGKNIYH